MNAPPEASSEAIREHASAILRDGPLPLDVVANAVRARLRELGVHFEGGPDELRSAVAGDGRFELLPVQHVGWVQRVRLSDRSVSVN